MTSTPHTRPKGELEREVRHVAGEVEGWRRDALLEAANLVEQNETLRQALLTVKFVSDPTITGWRGHVPHEVIDSLLRIVEIADHALGSNPASRDS